MVQRQILVVPQWQGSGEYIGYYEGAYNIAKWITDKENLSVIPVSQTVEPLMEGGIWYRAQLLSHMEYVRTLVEQTQPQSIVTVGGDCASDIISISYLNHLYKGNMTLLWLDAHADLHTPQSSPSGKFYGMPVRTLLGEGDPLMLEILPSVLKKEQLVYSGLQELDHEERQYIVEQKIVNLPYCSECIDMLEDYMTQTKSSSLYIHLDLDVLDSHSFSQVANPSSTGIAGEDLITALYRLKESKHIVGASITESLATDENDSLKRIWSAVIDIVGK